MLPAILLSVQWRKRLRHGSALAATTFCLAFVLSTGPQIQNYLLSLLNSDVPSIYDSVYQRQLVAFPSLGSWVGAAFQWQILAVALVVSWFALLSVNSRVIAWHTAWSAAVTLSAFDVFIALLNSQMTVKWVVENFASNIIGGVFCGGFILGIFKAADFVHNHAPIGLFGRLLLAPATVVTCGLTYCCVAYYVFGLFYAPLSAYFDVSLSPPASGALVSEDERGSKESPRAFSFVPDSRIRGNINWISPPGGFAIRSTITTEKMSRFRLFAVSGCTSASDFEKLGPAPSAWLDVTDMRDLEILGDSGMTDFMSLIPPERASKLRLNTDEASMFNLDDDVEQEGIKITQFVGKAASLEIESPKELKLFVGTPLMTTNEKKVTLSPRTVRLTIGQRKYEIRVLPPNSILDASQHLECEFVPDLKPLKEGGVNFEISGPIFGFLAIFERPADSSELSTEDIGIRVSAEGGWIALRGLQPKDLQHRQLGRLGMIQVRGNISDLSIDDASLSPRQVETYTAVGDFEGEIAQGKLRVRGQAKKLWKDQYRLSATKWEKLGWEPKIFLVTSLISLFGLLGTVVLSALRSDRRFLWYVWLPARH